MTQISRIMRCGTIGFFLALSAAPARADLCDRSLAVRVNGRGLDLIVKMVKPMLPETIVVPALDKVVVDWPLTSDDARLQMPEVTAKLKVRDLRAFMDGGALYIEGKFDVAAATPVTILNPFASFGKVQCQASLDFANIELQIGAQLDGESSRTKVHVTRATINFDEGASNASLDGCAIGNILSSVVSLLKSHLIGVAEKAIGTIAKSQIPTLMESKIDSAMQLQTKTQGLAVGVRVDGLATDEAGVSALISASLQSTLASTPPCLAGLDLTAPAVCAATTPALKPQLDAMFGAGVSEALLQQVLHALWRGGRMCLDSRTLADNPLIGTELTKLAAGLGLPSTAELAFQVRMAGPPQVKFSTAGGIALELNGLRLDLQLRLAPGADASQVGVVLDGAVSALPWIDPESASLALDLRSLAVRRLELIGQQGPLALDPARLQRFISEVVVPMLQKRLEGQALSPTVVNGMGLFLIDLRHIDVSDGFAAAYVDAYVPDAVAEDSAPPETVLVERPGAIVAPQLMRLLVGGSDNLTPKGLLRYRARVDGGPWTSPSYSRRIDVAITGGVRTVEVVALDLKGNVDPTPVLVQVLVDDKPPSLVVESRPDSLLQAGSAEVVVSADDDHSRPDQIQLQGELYVVPDGGGAPELVGSQPFVEGARSVRFDGLQSGVYKLRVIARDQAGNVTSQDVGFTADVQSGCNAAPGLPPLGSLLVLLALLVIPLARRR